MTETAGSAERPSRRPFRGEPRFGEAARFLAFGFWGGVLGLVFELVRVVFLHRGLLASVWEVQNGAFGLAPTWIFLGGLSGLAGGALLLGVQRARDERASTSIRARVGVAVVLAIAAGLTGWGVGGGRHLAALPLRLGFAGVIAAIAAGVTWSATPLLARSLGRPRRAALGFLTVALVLDVINVFVLPRLYPAFHAALSVAMMASGGAALALGFAANSRESAAPRGALAAALGLLGAAVVGLGPGSRLASGFDNFRWVVLEGSPSLALGVEWAAHVSPPPPLDEGVGSEPLGARRARSGSLDLRGRDLLLITVDALRADHVGAYGSTRGATPEIDRLAREGTLFEAAYAATPHTSYSLTSLMTGKYMRPLLLQGAGADSDLWPELLQTYGYRTAAFYPPAVFFIDGERFAAFRDRKFGFEYAKIEFAEGERRVEQVRAYLKTAPSDKRLFLWVHLFGPHEPYEEQLKSFGSRDIDRYDSEVHAADHTIGEIVKMMRERDARSAVVISADHGEEFGDHGGRYHGTSVYDEQVRVPLVVSIPGVGPGGRRVREPVQTIDLLPTVLSGLSVPIPPRIRGRDWGALLKPSAEKSGADKTATSALDRGFAASETEEYSLLAEAEWRLVCARRSGACQLYDIEKDPGQKNDLSLQAPDVLRQLRQRERSLAASHGEYETQGLRAEGKGWPPALLRGLSGDRSAAAEIAPLLDDADVNIRRKSAELLFFLKDPSQASALRLALGREDDAETRRWLSLALTRLGQGAPLVKEILVGPNENERHWAALALGEQGDKSGEDELVRWWTTDKALDFEDARALLDAFAELKSESAVPALVARLSDVRLRPYIAATLARIGDDDARPFLSRALAEERYVSARLPLARAIRALGGDDELVPPLTRFLGVPDPLEGGMALAVEADLVTDLGGPGQAGARQLRQLSDSGVQIDVTIPVAPRREVSSSEGATASSPSRGERARRVRVLLLARSRTGQPGQVRIEKGSPRKQIKEGDPSTRNRPEITDDDQLRFTVPATENPVQLVAEVPESWGFRPGHRVALEVYGDRHVEIQMIFVLPLREELPPPPPEPWEKKGD